jgi:hypothetical protein
MLTTNYKLLYSHHLKSWLIPLLVSVGLFWFIRPAMAQIVDGQEGLSDNLSGNIVDIGVEVVDGYSQVYYSEGGEKVFVNLGDQNKRHPDVNGEYMVWAGDVGGAGQVYRYHIPTDTLLQITHSGTNLQPKVSSNGQVVWEGWVDDEDTWQIFFFDGIKAVRLTQGDMSRNPKIAGDYISYGRLDISGTWRGVVYSINRGEEVEVTVGFDAKELEVDEDGNILLTGSGVGKAFPLMVEDLFLLEFEPLVAISDNIPAVTEEEIMEELEATTSAVIEE